MSQDNYVLKFYTLTVSTVESRKTRSGCQKTWLTYLTVTIPMLHYILPDGHCQFVKTFTCIDDLPSDDRNNF